MIAIDPRRMRSSVRTVAGPQRGARPASSHVAAIALLLLVASSPAHPWPLHLGESKPWTLAEYGAANYGRSEGQHPTRYQRLLETVDAIVEQHGPRGTVFLNDIHDLTDARRAVIEHAKAKGWQIDVQLRPGDMTKIELPHADFAHLSYPQRSMIDSGLVARLSRSADVLVVRTEFRSEIGQALAKLSPREFVAREHPNEVAGYIHAEGFLHRPARIYVVKHGRARGPFSGLRERWSTRQRWKATPVERIEAVPSGHR